MLNSIQLDVFVSHFFVKAFKMEIPWGPGFFFVFPDPLKHVIIDLSTYSAGV